MFLKIDKTVTEISRKISLISGIIMIVISVLSTANVLTSKILKWSIPGANDWVTYLFLAAVYCSIVYVRLGSGLISVDLISAHYPPLVKNIISILADLCGIAIFGAISIYSVPLLQSNIKYHSMSSTASGAFALWPFNLIVIIFSILMGLAMIWCILRIFVHGITKEIPKEQSTADGLLTEEGDIPS
jgi:TRAP-type C4-dicarboxylate transport system permease small subunit